MSAWDLRMAIESAIPMWLIVSMFGLTVALFVIAWIRSSK